MKLEFKIKFITPLLIHGANSREADTIGLTGKALRGCWRFWFRAIIGGLLQENELTPDSISKYESEIFGSANEKIGTKFKLLVQPISKLIESVTELKFSEQLKRGKGPTKLIGFQENCEFSLTIIPHQSLLKINSSNNDLKLKVLLGSIWVWANFGAIGQRARRGFGSPVIIPDINSPFNILFNNQLPLKETFTDKSDVENYLKPMFIIVQNTVLNWLPENIRVKDKQILPSFPYFILRSSEQILIADDPRNDFTLALQQVHGSNRCDDLGWARGNNRMASPIFTRFHKVNNSFLPVITYCPQKAQTREGERIIPNETCLFAYLYGKTCRHGVVFPYIGFNKE